MKRKLNKELLMNTLALQSESGHEWRVFAYIIRMCKNNGWKYEVDKMGNIYVTKGEADVYPAMVAHMDTVQSIVEDKTVMQIEDCLFAMNYYTMERIDIGGDDLVGVCIALHALHEFNNMKCAFYTMEENGCIGSYDSDVSFFNNVSFALQFDRTGNSGFVTNACGTELSSMEFQQTIEQTLSKYRYKMIRGGMTDVMALKEIGAIANMANVECGYYNPHSADSYVYIPEMERAMNLGFELIDKFGEWEFLPHHGEKEKWGYSTPKIVPHVHEDSYCMDCYAPTAKTDSGMCHNCEQYYIDEYEMELKRDEHGYNNW